MHLRLWAFVWIAAAFGVAGASAQETPQQCAAIADDTARLACYDALFMSAPLGDVTPVVLTSERLIPARPSGREPATLSMTCVDGVIEVSFAFAGQFVAAAGDIAPLTYQVDSNATLVRTMRASAGNTTLTFATDRETTTFLDGIVGGTNLKVRMTPVRQRSLTVDFRIDRVAAEIEALRAAC